MKCVLCGGKTIAKTVEHSEFGISLGSFKAKVCEKCNEIYFDESIAEKIQQKSKDLGLFGLTKKVKVAEVGNSIAIRIPKAISEFLKIKKGQEVTLIPETKKDLHIQV